MFRRGGEIFQKSSNFGSGGVLEGGIGTEAGEPMDVGFGAEPGPLALGVLAGAELHFGDGVQFGGGGAGEEGEGLFVAEGLEGLGGGGDAGGEEEADLIEETAAPDFDAAEIEAGV